MNEHIYIHLRNAPANPGYGQRWVAVEPDGLGVVIPDLVTGGLGAWEGVNLFSMAPGYRYRSAFFGTPVWSNNTNKFYGYFFNIFGRPLAQDFRTAPGLVLPTTGNALFSLDADTYIVQAVNGSVPYAEKRLITPDDRTMVFWYDSSQPSSLGLDATNSSFQVVNFISAVNVTVSPDSDYLAISSSSETRIIRRISPAFLTPYTLSFPGSTGSAVTSGLTRVFTCAQYPSAAAFSGIRVYNAFGALLTTFGADKNWKEVLIAPDGKSLYAISAPQSAIANLSASASQIGVATLRRYAIENDIFTQLCEVTFPLSLWSGSSGRNATDCDYLTMSFGPQPAIPAPGCVTAQGGYVFSEYDTAVNRYNQLTYAGTRFFRSDGQSPPQRVGVTIGNGSDATYVRSVWPAQNSQIRLVESSMSGLAQILIVSLLSGFCLIQPLMWNTNANNYPYNNINANGGLRDSIISCAVERTTRNLMFSRSYDGGATWTAARPVATLARSELYMPLQQSSGRLILTNCKSASNGGLAFASTDGVTWLPVSV